MMSDERKPGSLGALILSATAGLPAAVSKSAIGALNRLIAGIADIPAAYLAGLKENIEDGNYERRAFRRGLVDAATSKAVADDKLIDRTVERLLNEQERKQANREAIARETALLLIQRPSGCGDESEPVDEEWLSSFERFAEDASSERMQALWARVLNGEILKPGSFGRGTLRFIHELDASTAKAFEEVATHVLGRHVFAGEDVEPALFSKMLHLESLGVLSGSAGMIHYQAHADENGRFFIAGKASVLVGLADPKAIVPITATPLSQIGRELLKIVPNPDESKKARSSKSSSRRHIEVRHPGLDPGPSFFILAR